MSEKPVYQVRDLCALHVDALWNIPPGRIIVRCDDGDHNTTVARMHYSIILLRDFINSYPQTAVRVEHMLKNNVSIGKMTHARLLNKVIWDIFDTYAQRGEEVDLEVMAEKAYRATNTLYNVMGSRLGAYVQSLDIIDFIDVIHHPRIKTAQDNVKESHLSIQNVHDTITAVLRDANELKGNRLANIVKNGLVDMNQVVQCVGPRGYTTDMDSTIFRKPILVGLTHGFDLFVDSLMDSRLASKASSFTGPPLQATEYFNRQLQLLAHTVAGIVPGDCGTTDTIAWKVTSRDLSYLDGKNYIGEDGIIRRVSSDSTALIGTVIQMRSPMLCRNPDTQYCCQTCYGELARSIPRNTNVGHVSATNMGEKISQSVLAVKHVESSSAIAVLQFGEFARKFVRGSQFSETHIILSERLRDAETIKLTIWASEAANLNDLKLNNDVEQVQVSYYSELTEAYFDVKIEGKRMEGMIPVYMESAPASLTYDVLRHIKEDPSNRLTASESGDRYTIDLTDFDRALPVFEMPRRQPNMLNYAETIKEFLCAARGKGGVKTLRDYDDVGAALRAFYDLVSSRLKVNIVHMEILLRASMVRSRNDRDYRLPLPGNKVEFGEFGTIQFMRSLSSGLAYQGQKQALEKPALYLVEHRPMHTLDYMFVPNLKKQYRYEVTAGN